MPVEPQRYSVEEALSDLALEYEKRCQLLRTGVRSEMHLQAQFIEEHGLALSETFFRLLHKNKPPNVTEAEHGTDVLIAFANALATIIGPLLLSCGKEGLRADLVMRFLDLVRDRILASLPAHTESPAPGRFN